MRPEVREGGIEPPRRSYGVTARWAHHLPNSRWGALPESNRALQAPRACAFPRRQKAPVDQAGFEPAASGVLDRRSGLAELLIGASTSASGGASGGTRTLSPQIRNLML